MAGITSTTVDVRAGAAYQSFGVSMQHTYDQPVGDDVTSPTIAALAEQSSILAIQGLRDHLARIAAEGHKEAAKSPLIVEQQATNTTQGGQAQPAAVPQQAQPTTAQPAQAQPAAPAQPAAAQPAQPAQPASPQPQQPQAAAAQPQAQPAQLMQGNKPNNAGTFQFPPTNALDEDDLKEQVRQGVAGHGYDPDEFVVFDNRDDIEGGKQSWGFANVKAANESPWQGAIGKSMAFYVNAESATEVSVKPTKKLTEATA